MGKFAFAALLLGVLAVVGSAASARTRSTTTLESLSSTGEQGDSYSYGAAISGDGRYVVINSHSTNLAPGDRNDSMDVFLRDRVKGTTELVSVSSTGAVGEPVDGDTGSLAGGISSDGRYVVFSSAAPNLVKDDTSGARDVFLHDRLTGRTTRMSVNTAGAQANGESGFPTISADGRYVAFESGASNLVPSDTNGQVDVFVHDRRNGQTTRVSLSTVDRQRNGASEEPVLSAHGRYVAFSSPASNLVRGDTNKLADVFVRDRRSGKTARVSVSSGEKQSTGSPTSTGSNGPAISANGRYVAFHSDDSNLVRRDTNHVFDIFVRDRRTGQTRRVSVSSRGAQAKAESFGPALISADGRYVVFGSLAPNLARGDRNDSMDVFIRDRVLHKTVLASRGSTGAIGNSASGPNGLSADDRHLVFSSWAGNLVPNDVSPGPDAFVRTFARRPR